MRHIIEFIRNSIVDDWRMVAFKSYTALAVFVVLFCVWASDIIYLIAGIDTNPATWTCLLSVSAVFVYVGRLIKQPKRNSLRRKIIVAGIVLATVLVAVPAIASTECPGDVEYSVNNKYFNYCALPGQPGDPDVELIARWEGKKNYGYLDIVDVPTICYGHTATARLGQYRTDAQCTALLIADITSHRCGLYGYFTTETKRDRLPALREAAYVSLAFNVGVRAAGRSTATRRINKNNIKGGCKALSWWNKAGGRVVRGLVRRRSAEVEMCLKGR